MVLRIGKRPVNQARSSVGWNKLEFWLTFDAVKNAYTLCSDLFDGIGFIADRDGNPEGTQIQLGDLDCCRDPVTGYVSGWAKSILDQLNTYSELSPSGCGFRFIN
jgi:putative DNA primase/helicase